MQKSAHISAGGAEGQADAPLNAEPDTGVDSRTRRSWPELKVRGLTNKAIPAPL